MRPPKKRSPFPTKTQNARLVAAFFLVLASLAGGSVRAAGTDPLLTVESARLVVAPSGARTLEVSGQFSLDDLLQFSFPAGLVIVRGAHWVRFDFDGTIAHGSYPGLAHGVTSAKVTALLGAGVPAAPPAAILRVTPTRLAVALPADFPGGAATVLVYAVLEGETFISNGIGVALP